MAGLGRLAAISGAGEGKLTFHYVTQQVVDYKDRVSGRQRTLYYNLVGSPCGSLQEIHSWSLNNSI